MTILQYILAAFAILIMFAAVIFVIAFILSDLCVIFRDPDDDDNYDV